MASSKLISKLPLHLKIALSLIVFLILASCFSRQLNGLGWDFQAYYNAAGRILEGKSPYHYEKDFSYKYAPIIAVPFTFFHLFSYDIARWIYAALHALVAIAGPYLLYSILLRDPKLSSKLRIETFCIGILVSFLGTFRFIDSEFHVSQIGLWIIGLLLVGTYFLTFNKNKTSYLGIACLSLASLVKIHSLLLFMLFSKPKAYKTWFLSLSILLIFVILPNPLWWLDWAQHMKRSSYDLPMDMTSVNLQGFYSFAVLKLGMNQFSLWPFVLAAPFGLWAYLKTPRFSLSEISQKPHAFLLSLSVWVLLGILASPLPWQYTYSLMWIIIPLSWISATRLERRILFVSSLFLGLSPQGIVGKSFSIWLEQKQSIFFVMLIIWILLLVQSQRVYRED